MRSDAKASQKTSGENDKCPLPDHTDAWDKLTPIEKAVAFETSTGATSQEVGSRVGISVHMVALHLTRIYRKLGVDRRGLITDRWATLSARQKAVVNEAITGATHREIGLRLGIPDRTRVQKCLRKALQKLGMAHRRELIQYPYNQLSPFQRRVALMVSRGDANRHIIAALGVSEKNVTRNLDKIYKKLGVSGRLDLIVEILSHQPASRLSSKIDSEKSQQYYDSTEADLLRCFGMSGPYSDQTDSEGAQ